MKDQEWHIEEYEKHKYAHRGPWDHEPDKMQFTDPATGLPCLILRNSSGALCGYVGVSEEHPWFSVGYSQCLQGHDAEDDSCYEYDHTPGSQVRVHGGLTYSAFCMENKEKICHLVEPGEPDRVWWFGFDTAHSEDLMPKYKRGWSVRETYRDVKYVKEEIARLAEQLAAITRG